ncbi:mannonate dehydratase [Sinomicrobium soli]|uniref:mannonate dehydratase n=1 Tax=Sinomicrobium sp. N-1-3-6 TaxID=2219864 RepID=UPI000DCF579D|nr:mannonate dehydratase [Sinomicrobium sp. N-1-3-6]RAV29629.1 mannonate dehydratase [Sinomicrobium sp. N-1-3-6]
MQQTMRWYGPQDGVSLEEIRQAGASGVVTALHEIPVGEVWSEEAIRERLGIVHNAGLEWTVIESLPVHEDIKRRQGNYKLYIENYKKSLKHIAACGLEVVTYNFMPVLDWVRTDTFFVNDDGTRTLRFEREAFMYFDLFLLRRPGAEDDYSQEEKEQAAAYGDSLTSDEQQALFRTVLLGLPGSKESFTPEKVLGLLKQYEGIDDEKLRENLYYFLGEVAPLAEELGLKLAIHPDDPPFSVLGLPRIVCSEKDIARILDAVPVNANGLCYCTGSLGANPDNDLPAILERHGDRIHFLHLRSVAKEKEGVFREAEHLSGDAPMSTIVYKVLLLMNKRGHALPMRPDHGALFTLEQNREHFSGYSLIGRLKGLAEIRGLEQGLVYAFDNVPM